MRSLYRSGTVIFGLLAIAIGVGIIVQTARHGGGFGYVIGLLFAALGVGRIYLVRQRR
jgi:hypothetical protein